MKMIYRPDIKSHLTLDNKQKVRTWEAMLPKIEKTKAAVQIPPFRQKVVGLKSIIPRRTKIGHSLKHFVQHCQET